MNHRYLYPVNLVLLGNHKELFVHSCCWFKFSLIKIQHFDIKFCSFDLSTLFIGFARHLKSENVRKNCFLLNESFLYTVVLGISDESAKNASILLFTTN